MAGATVRINQAARQSLRDLAEETGEPMQTILERAIETYRRQHLLRKTNDAFARLRRNPKAWKQELAERAAWDAALPDDTDGE